MKSELAALAVGLAAAAIAQQWNLALPGYQYQFPRDYFDHPDYQTEWWYYTGNLRSSDGHRFGFELTFFRFNLNLSRAEEGSSTAVWRPNPIYVAHLALSDIDKQRFYHAERVNRAGPGLAGVDNASHRYWNGNWQVQWKDLDNKTQYLEAVCDEFTLRLDLTSTKPVVINGVNGVSQKGPLPGEASHYLSLTHSTASGNLDGTAVTGTVWMDHEFFTEQLDKTLNGWDWFAIQLDNNEELMLYRLRRQDGRADPFSSGTYVDARGSSHSLDASQFQLSPIEDWLSPHSGAHYPIGWSITVPSLGLHLDERTALKDQELFSTNHMSPTYWEGAVIYRGEIHKQPVSGVGYVELTGYAPGGLSGQPK